jgi:hypothetical protein
MGILTDVLAIPQIKATAIIEISDLFSLFETCPPENEVFMMVYTLYGSNTEGNKNILQDRSERALSSCNRQKAI